jgi:hypothetical protein
MCATGITNNGTAGLASSDGGARSLPSLSANLQLARSGEESRLWVNLYFAYVAVATFAYGLIVTRISRNWIISDWLINYRGGFVRRGLPGQIAYSLSHLLHISTVSCVVFFYLSLYGIFLAATRRLALHSSRSLWLLALIFSPATFAFQILHAQGGFRKEIIYLVALTSLAVWLREMQPTSVAVSISLTIAVLVCVLSHESLLFYSPYFVAVLLLSGLPINVVARVCIAPAIAAMVAAVWCSMHHGNAAVASQICSSLGYKLLSPASHDICGSGAIPYLGNTSSMARAETLLAATQNHYLAIFPWFALAALIPAIMESIALVRAGGQRDVLTLWSCVAVSFCASIVLFLYAQDWGRWIYIHVTSITVLLLLIDGRIVRRGSEAGLVRVKAQLIRHRAPIAAFLFAYAVTWALPINLYGVSPRMGYLSRFPELVHLVYPGTSRAAEYK